MLTIHLRFDAYYSIIATTIKKTGCNAASYRLATSAIAREKFIDRFAYLPFGVGPRICIGATFAIQEASIVVAAIMRNFTLEMAPGYNAWPMQKVTLRPKDGLPMIVRRR